MPDSSLGLLVTYSTDKQDVGHWETEKIGKLLSDFSRDGAT